MLFANGSNVVLLKASHKPHEGWPQTAMHIGDFAFDQTAHENLVAASHEAHGSENALAGRMLPPASTNGSSGYGLSEVWNGAFRAFQDNSISPHKSDGIGVHANFAKN